MPRRSSRTCLTAFVAAALAAFTFATRDARAEGEGEEGPSAVEKEIRAQMEKVLELMKANEAAILEASKRGGEKPAGVEVEKPIAPEAPKSPESSANKGDGSDSTSPGARGEDAKKKLDELIRVTKQRGSTIPGELEELVKLIPT